MRDRKLLRKVEAVYDQHVKDHGVPVSSFIDRLNVEEDNLMWIPVKLMKRIKAHLNIKQEEVIADWKIDGCTSCGTKHHPYDGCY